MNIRFILHRAVSQTKFGHEGVLAAINLDRKNSMSMQMLTNKLNPHSESHTINVQELELIADVVDAHIALADYHAQKCNAVVVPIPAEDDFTGDMNLLDSFVQATISAGDFASEFQRAWADGRITPEEFKALRMKLHNQIAKQLGLLARIEQVVG